MSKWIPEHYRRAYITFKWLVKRYITRSDCPVYGVGSNMRSYYLKVRTECDGQSRLYSVSFKI